MLSKHFYWSPINNKCWQSRFAKSAYECILL